MMGAAAGEARTKLATPPKRRPPTTKRTGRDTAYEANGDRHASDGEEERRPRNEREETPPTERTARRTGVDPGGGMRGAAAGEAMDHSGEVVDWSGRPTDRSGTTVDRSATAADHAGTAADHAGTAADWSKTTADRSTATVDRSGVTADWSGMVRDSGPNGLKLSDRGWREEGG